MEFKDIQKLEDENIQDDIFRTKSQDDLDKFVRDVSDKVGKTDNDLGLGSKKNGGGFFSKLWSKLFGKNSQDTKDIEVELEEIKNDALFDDTDGGEGLKEKKEVKEEQKEKDKKEEKKGNEKVDRIDDNGRKLDEILDELEKEENAGENNAGEDNVAKGKVDIVNGDKGNPGNDVDRVGADLEEIFNEFDVNDDNGADQELDPKKVKAKKKAKGKKSSKDKKNNIEMELEELRDDLDEDGEKKDEEEEVDERDEYVYDPKLHWGTTNLLHSFLYHKGEKYRFSEHGKVRNWFHKKLFGSYRSQVHSQRAIDKEKKRLEKEENKSGRYYGDDVAYKRWEHNGVRNWFHDKWYHMKNSHRKTVERFYKYHADYSKMPWYQRMFWCVKNPLARIMVNFPNTIFAIQARENLLKKMRMLYRQAISEGFIPKSNLGDLDYDPLSGTQGSMTRASEQAQQAFEATKLSATRKKNIDLLKAARASVLNNLMVINGTRDLVVQRCVAKGLDPKAGDKEYLNTPAVRNAYIRHLNGLRKADWEIAKQEALDDKTKKMPNEDDDPAKNPIVIGKGDDETQKLIKLVNKELGLPEDHDIIPQSTINSTSEDFIKENKAVEKLESLQSLSTGANYGSMGVDNLVGYKLGGPALIGTDIAVAYFSLLERKKALSKGDTIAARKHTANMIKYGVDVSDRIGGMVMAAKGLQGAAFLVGPGTMIAGTTDVVLGVAGAKQYTEVIKEIKKIEASENKKILGVAGAKQYTEVMQEIKKLEDAEKQKSYNSKALDMMKSTMKAEKSAAIDQVVAGAVNTTGGALMATGVFSTLGLIISLSSLGISYISNSVLEGRKKDKAVKNVNVEMGLVERQRKLWEYYLNHGGQPSEYSRGMTKRAVLMEEGFEKGTRSQAAFQQRINYAQKITDNINSVNPDPTYLKLIKSLKVEKGADDMYHMEAVATALGADSKSIARSFLSTTSDNEFIDVAEKMKRKDSKLDDKISKNEALLENEDKKNVPGAVDKALEEIAAKKRLEAEAEEKSKKAEEEQKKNRKNRKKRRRKAKGRSKG